uniref:Uncharacterized protein n=1 Tax=Arundo donax TaxID=35708 RepID=A0A0A9FC08_ARUDO
MCTTSMISFHFFHQNIRISPPVIPSI